MARARRAAPRRRPIDHDPRPGRRLDVAVALALERIGLEEGDLVAARRERLEDAAVVGRRAVPVGREQARAVERDPHAAASSRGARSARARARRRSRAARRPDARSCGAASIVRRPWRGERGRQPRLVQHRRAAPPRIAAPSCAIRKSSPGLNRPSASSQGAETSGMPQASASNTRIVGMPGSASRIGPARHVHGDACAGECLRHQVVGQPAAKRDAPAAQPAQRLVRIAHAVDRGIEAEVDDRAQQVLLELGGALVVAPVADPDEVELLRPRPATGRSCAGRPPRARSRRGAPSRGAGRSRAARRRTRARRRSPRAGSAPSPPAGSARGDGYRGTAAGSARRPAGGGRAARSGRAGSTRAPARGRRRRAPRRDRACRRARSARSPGGHRPPVALERRSAVLAHQVAAGSSRAPARARGRRGRAPAARAPRRAGNGRCRGSSRRPANGRRARPACRLSTGGAQVGDRAAPRGAAEHPAIDRERALGAGFRRCSARARRCAAAASATRSSRSVGQPIDGIAARASSASLRRAEQRRPVPQLAEGRDVAQHQRAAGERGLERSRGRTARRARARRRRAAREADRRSARRARACRAGSRAAARPLARPARASARPPAPASACPPPRHRACGGSWPRPTGGRRSSPPPARRRAGRKPRAARPLWTTSSASRLAVGPAQLRGEGGRRRDHRRRRRAARPPCARDATATPRQRLAPAASPATRWRGRNAGSRPPAARTGRSPSAAPLRWTRSTRALARQREQPLAQRRRGARSPPACQSSPASRTWSRSPAIAAASARWAAVGGGPATARTTSTPRAAKAGRQLEAVLPDPADAVGDQQDAARVARPGRAHAHRQARSSSSSGSGRSSWISLNASKAAR